MSVIELLFKYWLAVKRLTGIYDYKGMCIAGYDPPYLATTVVLGRADGGFVLAVDGSSSRYHFKYIKDYVDVVKEDGEDPTSSVTFKGLIWAKPVVIADERHSYVRFDLARRHVGSFKPKCVPPLAGSRWWVFYPSEGIFLKDEGLNYFLDEESLEETSQIFVLTERGISVYCRSCIEFDEATLSPCKYAFGGKWLYHSPIGPPVSAPGAGSLSGAELPVVRHRDRYLRVGPWLAWHRVLGILDDGKWVIIGDDGLYEAEFIPTVKYPLEEFGEVGYVRVLGPYGGDVDDVQSPCGAPRLVACTEDTREALISAGHSCNEGGGIPHVLLGSGDAIKLGREVIDWPLRDPCDLLTQFPFVFNPVL